MHCPICGYRETKVIDSRLVHDGARVRRRRECLHADCGERFTTYEEAEVSLPLVIKQDGTREQYSADKLRRGLLRAVEKRPVSIDTVNNLIDTIEQRLRHYSEREVPAKRIGQWVMDGLKAIDHVAYIRFASVYLSFADVAAFQKTIDELSSND